MNNHVVSVSHLSMQFGATQALRDVSFSLPPGRILGVLGPNGAGKTTLLRALVGMVRGCGDVCTLGLDPVRQHRELMTRVAFIADVAILPRWMKVKDMIRLMEGIHPQFSRAKCASFLAKTHVSEASRVRDLSKGMLAQLHLAVIMAVDARLLVLDEPTLGLDPLYRRTFFRALVEDYFDAERTIILSTHQVDEVAGLLTDVAFMREGRWLAHMTVDEMSARFHQVRVSAHDAERARKVEHLSEHRQWDHHAFVFDPSVSPLLATFGDVRPAPLADVFETIMTAPTPFVGSEGVTP